MPAKGVLVKCYYNGVKSSGSGSGIRFDGGLILLHGTILRFLIENRNSRKWLESFLSDVTVEVGAVSSVNEVLTFEVFDEKTDENVLPDEVAHSGRRMVVGMAWKCPLVKKSADENHRTEGVRSVVELYARFVRELFSVFMIAKIPGEGECVSLRTIADIADGLCEPVRGEDLIVESTPLALHPTINTITRGIVGCVFGWHRCMFLTDAATAIGSHGGPVFRVNGSASHVKGPLLGVVLGCFAFSGTCTSFTVAISLLPVFYRLLPPWKVIRNYTVARPQMKVPDIVDETVFLICCGRARGTGVVLDAPRGILITCSHIIQNDHSRVYVYRKGNYYLCDVVYRTKSCKAYDLAVIKTCESNVFTKQMEMALCPAVLGERVYSAGFPYDESLRDCNQKLRITSGCVAKSSQFLIRTTCPVTHGCSGGAILRDGKLLGIISCCMTVRPSLSHIIPATVFREHIKKYLETDDVKHLDNLESTNENAQRVWGKSKI